MTAPSACVIGAGPSGLTALQVLRARGIPAVCFEKGVAVGGQWRYENESGTSATWSSLEMMSSRWRSGLRRFPVRRGVHAYPLLREMQEHLEDFARTFDLFEDIEFEQEVVSVSRTAGGYRVRTARGEDGVFSAVLVANGHHTTPRWPATLPAGFAGETIHSAAYRTPDAHADRRVVVVGCGNSALEIAGEVSEVARSTTVSARGGGWVLPRSIGPVPLDWFDTAASTRVPFRVRRAGIGAALKATGRGPSRYGLPEPDHGVLQRVPLIVEGFDRRVLEGAVEVRPQVVGASGRTLHFADGSSTTADQLICATGFELSLPFLAEPRIDADSRPLYRRIVHPDFPGLFFIGLIDPNGALLPVVEGQSEWVADVIEGRMALPDGERMHAEIERDSRAHARRFVPPGGPSTWLLCDRWPYLRQLAHDRRRARRGRRRG